MTARRVRRCVLCLLLAVVVKSLVEWLRVGVEWR